MPKRNDPRCDKLPCFAYDSGYCTILTETINKKKCPFFKTKEQVAHENEIMLKKFRLKGLIK